MLTTLPRPARAAIVGASGGIGAALVASLAAADFAAIHALSRRPTTATERNVVPSIVDITDESSIASAAKALAMGSPLRLVVAATGLLHDGTTHPEKAMRALDAAQLAHGFAVNTIGPAMFAKHVLPLLPRSQKSVFAVLSARVGSIEDNRLGGWYGYRAQKAALNQIIRTLAVEMRRTHPDAVVVALHPGTVATDLSAPFRGNVRAEKLFTPGQAARHLLNVIDRLTPADSGGFFAWDGTRIPF
jgi:NAD(P)-dependent dehydrogenase (short-subunit alcohol dehydrogenase family)